MLLFAQFLRLTCAFYALFALKRRTTGRTAVREKGNEFGSYKTDLLSEISVEGFEERKEQTCLKLVLVQN